MEKIERVTKHMSSLALNEGFKNNNTTFVSQFLNRLLNELNRISTADQYLIYP
ncbi:aspartyl-phosphate phosphatase Spo0E family protein [Priestia aryabhattai]|uniref:aspartyl-phosphate phosphatase Spo0E family protein n=1 Tax=Priestia megaterium TaxID=1404 RepID=UPI0039B9CFE9